MLKSPKTMWTSLGPKRDSGVLRVLVCPLSGMTAKAGGFARLTSSTICARDTHATIKSAWREWAVVKLESAFLILYW